MNILGLISQLIGIKTLRLTQTMQQQLERLNFVLGEVRDRMDLQDAAIRNLQGRRDRRRREPRVENEYENEGDGEDE